MDIEKTIARLPLGRNSEDEVCVVIFMVRYTVKR